MIYFSKRKQWYIDITPIQSNNFNRQLICFHILWSGELSSRYNGQNLLRPYIRHNSWPCNPIQSMSITIITNWHNVIFYRTEANKNVDRNYLSKPKYTYNYLWSAWCMLTPRYKNKLCLVNFLFVHCNDKKDMVERTLYRRK